MAKRKPLFWQLYPSYFLITVISLIAVAWYASSSLRHFFLERIGADLEVRALLFGRQIQEHLDPVDEEVIDRLCKEAGRPAATRITVMLPSGKVVGDSEENPANMDTHRDRPEFLEALSGTSGVSRRFSRTLGKNLMYVAIPVNKAGRPVAVIRASIPVDPIERAIRATQLKIAVGGLIMAVFAAVLGIWVSRRIAGPIGQLERWAEGIARGEFRFRPPQIRSEEIGALSDTLGRMAVELRERIETIMRQRNEMEGILSSMVEGVIAVDMEERIISMNDAAGRIFGSNPADARGRGIQEVVRNTDLQAFVGEALSGEGLVEREIVLPGEGDLFLNGHGTLLRDAEGRNMGALIVLNDLTQLKRLENIRREFVANVSHEIKTPLTAIRGSVETLRDGAHKNPEDARRFLGIVESHVNRLETIIDDLLSLSKIEQEEERGEVLRAESRIRDSLEAAVEICRVRAEARNIGIHISCTEDISAEIDAPLFEQAIVNLLDNAVKYSQPESHVRIEAARKTDEIAVSVHDQGCGIRKEHLPRLFERFYRVDKARSRQLGGTGLGLAIVKHIIQAHGGRLSVESTPGKGSTFTIHLPISHSS